MWREVLCHRPLSNPENEPYLWVTSSRSCGSWALRAGYQGYNYRVIIFFKSIFDCNNGCTKECLQNLRSKVLLLTLSLLMSYIYMELLVKPEILTSYIHVPTFGNAESRLYFLYNVPTLYQCRKVFCGTIVFNHFASYQDYPNYRWDLIRYAKGKDTWYQMAASLFNVDWCLLVQFQMLSIRGE
jgi:hypothetical protein